VQLKLSSTAFKSPSNPNSGKFSFDKQGVNFPYDSFEQVMKSNLTKAFVNVDQSSDEEVQPAAGRSEREEEEGEQEQETPIVVPNIHKIPKRVGKYECCRSRPLA
jgi:hypothetical protein